MEDIDKEEIAPLRLSDAATESMTHMMKGVKQGMGTGVDSPGDILSEDPVPLDPIVPGYHVPDLPPIPDPVRDPETPSTSKREEPEVDAPPLEAGLKQIKLPKEVSPGWTKADIVKEVLRALEGHAVILSPEVTTTDSEISMTFKTIPSYHSPTSSSAGRSTSDIEGASIFTEDIEFRKIGGAKVKLSLATLGITKEVAKQYILGKDLGKYFMDKAVASDIKLYKLMHLSEKGKKWKRIVSPAP
ncbi:phosphoprotein [Blanchseco virus]|uniref:Phosphoprotein n=1 Tax=Blanchseco virus TaxID=2704630 RepID=A0A5B8H8G6_9RHAB|nr:phosphoprotein [Blanchseco virus]QDW81030.1 phosphoprotein [Blanchseco virus]